MYVYSSWPSFKLSVYDLVPGRGGSIEVVVCSGSSIVGLWLYWTLVYLLDEEVDCRALWPRRTRQADGLCISKDVGRGDTAVAAMTIYGDASGDDSVGMYVCYTSKRVLFDPSLYIANNHPNSRVKKSSRQCVVMSYSCGQLRMILFLES